ncbi:12683_t:CDS:2, partial [Acaulospora morrowiae]
RHTPTMSNEERITTWLSNYGKDNNLSKEHEPINNDLEDSHEIVDLTCYEVSGNDDSTTSKNMLDNTTRYINGSQFLNGLRNVSISDQEPEGTPVDTYSFSIKDNMLENYSSPYLKVSQNSSTIQKLVRNIRDSKYPPANNSLDNSISFDHSTGFYNNFKNLDFSVEDTSRNNEADVLSDDQSIFNPAHFTDSFSASRSIEDFLLLRGKMISGKRQEIEPSKLKFSIRNNDEQQSKVPSISNTPCLYTNENVIPDDRHSQQLVPSIGPQFKINDSSGHQNLSGSMTKDIIDTLPMPMNVHKYIISVRMLANRGFLTSSRGVNCKLEFVERDFEYMRPLLLDIESETLHVECDVILDENTGIIFYPLNLISQEHSVPKIARTLVRLHQKYPNLYLILESYTWNHRPSSNDTESLSLPYFFTLPVLKALTELQIILTCCLYNTHIMFSPCEEISARLVRMVGEFCAAKCDEESERKGWTSKQQWESRDWMTMEESLHERFLSCLSPLINPFTAQIILTATTLSQFFKMSHQERVALVGGWIDEARLEKFDILIHEELLSNPGNDTENLFSSDGLPVFPSEDFNEANLEYFEPEWDTSYRIP